MAAGPTAHSTATEKKSAVPSSDDGRDAADAADAVDPRRADRRAEPVPRSARSWRCDSAMDCRRLDDAAARADGERELLSGTVASGCTVVPLRFPRRSSARSVAVMVDRRLPGFLRCRWCDTRERCEL